MFNQFTFHHVSIKTMCMVSDKLAGKTFTFHHVSIKTMLTDSIVDCIYLNSHSTMYLLKLVITSKIQPTNLFTFHHVSIKTNHFLSKIFATYYSHSTMYLLKQ